MHGDVVAGARHQQVCSLEVLPPAPGQGTSPGHNFNPFFPEPPRNMDVADFKVSCRLGDERIKDA